MRFLLLSLVASSSIAMHRLPRFSNVLVRSLSSQTALTQAALKARKAKRREIERVLDENLAEVRQGMSRYIFLRKSWVDINPHDFEKCFSLHWPIYSDLVPLIREYDQLKKEKSDDDNN